MIYADLRRLTALFDASSSPLLLALPVRALLSPRLGVFCLIRVTPIDGWERHFSRRSLPSMRLFLAPPCSSGTVLPKSYDGRARLRRRDVPFRSRRGSHFKRKRHMMTTGTSIALN